MSERAEISGRSTWKRTTLGEALPIRYGKARSEKHGIVREETAVYGSSGVIDTFKRALTNGPTLVIGRKGTVGATHYSPEPCWPIDTVYFAEAEADKDLRFFKYLLDHLQLGKMDRSTAVPGLSRDDYNATEVSIPDVNEQRRIVAEIEKQFTRLEAGVVGLRRVQANLKRYRAAVLKAACEGKLVPTEAELARQSGRGYETGAQLLARTLTERRQKWTGRGKYKEPAAPDTTNLLPVPEGWTWCMSDSLFSFVTSGSRGWAKHYSDSGAIFLRIGNLDHENIRLDLGDIQHVTPPTGTEGVRTMVQADDILVSITADVGMVALVPDGLGEAYINQHVALARPLPTVCPRYVAYYLCGSEGGWGYFKKLQRGATKVGLGLDDIRSVPVPLPPFAEQERIVAEVERRLSVVEELEAVVSANFQRAQRLRQAVLNKHFVFTSNEIAWR